MESKGPPASGFASLEDCSTLLFVPTSCSALLFVPTSSNASTSSFLLRPASISRSPPALASSSRSPLVSALASRLSLPRQRQLPPKALCFTLSPSLSFRRGGASSSHGYSFLSALSHGHPVTSSNASTSSFLLRPASSSRSPPALASSSRSPPTSASASCVVVGHPLAPRKKHREHKLSAKPPTAPSPCHLFSFLLFPPDSNNFNTRQ